MNIHPPSLNSVCLLIEDCLHATAPIVDEGFPLIRTPNIGKGRLLLNGVQRITEETYVEWTRRGIPKDGDLILAREAPAGNVAIVKNGERVCLGQRTVLIRPDPDKVDPDFLCYFLLAPESQAFLLSNATGVTAPHVNMKDIRRLPLIGMPSLEKQIRIGGLLTAYDDLIENNRRRMVLLEESARLLYREWFVRLRFPGHESTRIVNGVPEGWECVPLEQVAEFRLGKMLDQVKNKGEEMPYLANINVRWGEVDLSGLREMRFKEDELETFGLKFGDIVMCEGGEPGRCAIWKEQLPGMMFQKAIHRIRCRENMEYVYLYQNLRHQAQAGHLASLFTGATIKHFPREKLAKVTVVVPPKQLLDLFAEHVIPIETQLGRLVEMNRQASKARDLLLPKLMSGEIEV